MGKLRPLFRDWCVWGQGDWREGKDGKSGYFEKLPKNPATGGACGTNSRKPGKGFGLPFGWGTYEQAETRLKKGGYKGIGALMASGEDIIVVDVDKCINEDGSLAPVAQLAMEILSATFCEVSQSGKGLHFVLKGCLPDGVTGQKRTIDGHSEEIYGKTAKRFMGLTGREWQGGRLTGY